MTLRFVRFVTLGVFVLSTAALLAHDEFRIVGTITKRAPTVLTVKSKEGEIVAMKLTKETLVYRDKKKVAATELKNGLTVVVDALGDSFDDLEAVEIAIVPAIKPAAK